MVVGIDVGKFHLDVALGTQTKRYANDERGIQALVEALTPKQPERIAFEPTGVYHLPLRHALAVQGWSLLEVNPVQSSALRAALGKRNKTDKEDARLLAECARLQLGTPAQTESSQAEQAKLRRLLSYRTGLLKRTGQVRSQLEAASWAQETVLIDLLEQDLAHLEQQLHTLDAQLDAQLTLLPEAEVLLDMKGVGRITSLAVLAYLPRSLWGQSKAAASFAGIHPALKHSGRSTYSALSRKGHAGLRQALYMAALVAVRHDESLKAFYQQLISRGKAKKQALLAAAHKLLRRMMGRLNAFYNGREPS